MTKLPRSTCYRAQQVMGEQSEVLPDSGDEGPRRLSNTASLGRIVNVS